MVISDYDDEMLQQINENADLISYVGQTLDLEQRGDNYFAHCPKHVDETPSLAFSKSKNFYHCFSCGRSGRIIGYLIDYEGLKFDEAVNKAAHLANIDLSNMCQSKTISFLRKVKSVYQKKKQPYQHTILNEKEYEKYKKEAIEEWEREGISRDVLNLFDVRADTFQNRIVYPVRDINGKLINIKGRTRYKNYKELKIPKYINYFSVGTMDYFQGLNVTLPYILQKNEVIIFEGIKSVMKMYSWGYKNCVSAEKHTLTNEQVELLAKLKVDIVLAYDSDVDYRSTDTKSSIDKLKRITNVYIINDRNGLLGGKETKNAPVDLGKEVWDELYRAKRKVV